MLARVRNWFDPREVHETGQTPDYRFSLANERTFLAWIRTGLAMIGGGLVVAQFLPPMAVPHMTKILGVALILLGVGCALRAVDHWIRCEIAMRNGRPLPPSRFPAVLAIVVALGSLALLGEVFVDWYRSR
ncbi:MULTISPECIES: YidH family protein [Catellatospora]|uniref:YidH family protein n=1 Tax=Catellatospora TaxID=53365 RepID=UPI000E7701A9|nr:MULTISPECIES: DUF202 domain-containing protein [Catellatospora]